MACFLAPATAAIITTTLRKKNSSKYHLDWLAAMLWGGVVMLIVEHISHGEVLPYPPFLTAGLAEVLPEILRVGVPMVLAIFSVWVVMILVATKIKKKESPSLKNINLCG